ncbi:MAG: ribonuclease Z [Bacteroidales bacterium]
MQFKLTILGSSSAVPTSHRNLTAHALRVHERFFLIDCGEGTQMQLRRHKIPFGRIHHIFITHLHGDHIFGLYGLLSSYNLLFRKEDLHIYAPAQLQNILEHHLCIFEPRLHYKIIYHPLASEEKTLIYEDKHVQVFSFPLFHKVPTFGFLFQEKPYERNLKKEVLKNLQIPISNLKSIKQGEDWVTDAGVSIPNKQLTLPPYKARSFAYCSDTLYGPSLTRFFPKVDLLFHEATFGEDLKKQARLTMHSTAAQAAKMACKAEVSRLLIGHFSARYKDSAPLLEEARAIFPETYCADDGLTFSIPLIREEDKKGS